MEGKILGIPLVLILLVIVIALLIDVPMALLNQTTQERLANVEANQFTTTVQLHKVEGLLVPTATPTVTPTPTVKGLKSITVPATRSGQVR